MESVGEFEYSTKDLIGHGAFAVVFKGRHRTGTALTLACTLNGEATDMLTLKRDFVTPSIIRPTHSYNAGKGHEIVEINFCSRKIGANDKNHALTVAIKSITKKNLSKSQNLLGKEIKILKELTELHHENVVALLDCKETAHHVYLVMEYCNGGDLADYLHAKGTLSEDTIRFFLRQIAGAMRALYAKGIVHRDLKPQNILLCHAGKLSTTPTDITLKIADFGFARFLEDGVMAATLCGSPMYMAPEVIMSLQYDAKADLWSIGTIVFQCLTGKAPFQAQTPQALKQFYEKNCSISPRIPSGTSPELSNLLVQLLKRNAKDRMDFDDFFCHPFLQPVHRISSPVRLHSYVSLSPEQESALSSVDFPSPSPTTFTLAPQTWFHKLEGMPQEGCAKDKSSSLSPEEQDFVIVSANLSEDMQCDTNHLNIKMHTGEITRCSSMTNDNPLASDVDQSCVWMPSSESTHPSVSTAIHGDVIAATAAVPYTASDPIPVPSQKKAYQKIQHSLQDFASSSPKISNELLQDSSSLSSITSSKSIPIPVRRGSVSSLSSELEKAANIAALSPPSVQFSIGVSPTRRRRSYSGTGGISHTDSSLRQRAGGVIHCRLFNHLSTAGSPSTKEMVRTLQSGSMSSPCKESALTSVQGLDQKNINVISCPLKFTFASRTVPFAEMESKGFHSNSSPGSVMIPCQKTCWLGSRRDIHGSPNKTHLGSTSHICGDSSAGSLLVLGSSPQDMNGTQFVAPDLPEETLLQKDHNETLAKLNFILALVECILDLARSRSTPLAILTDATLRKHRVDDVLLTNEGYRRAEQLVLYMRALQLLSSSLQLSKKEVQAGRLQPSASVKKVLCIMKKHYHHCVNMCRSLNNPSFLQSTGVDLASSSITADRLIYNYAIEMCQSAALEELFGNPEECFHHYQTAQILLHSLAQQVNDHQDRQLLNKYKDAVEKRLFVLHSQGYVYVYNSS